MAEVPIKLHARATLVLDHINPSSHKSANTTKTTPSITYNANWARLDAIVLQWIYGTIDPTFLTTILDPDNKALDAWTKLGNL